MIGGRQVHYLDRSTGPEIVIIHGLGGAVALALALDHPEVVGGLTLIAPLTQPQDTVPDSFEAASADLVGTNGDLPCMVARYPSIAVPTAILYGRDDAILDRLHHGEGLASMVPGHR